jgi:hypothetical protein
LELTGYGVFEFAAVIFLLSAAVYHLMFRLTNHAPNGPLIQIHFWPSLVFALFASFLAHWVNRVPSATVHDPTTEASLRNWLTAFTWATLAFVAFRLVFAIAAARGVLLNRNPGRARITRDF